MKCLFGDEAEILLSLLLLIVLICEVLVYPSLTCIGASLSLLWGLSRIVRTAPALF